MWLYNQHASASCFQSLYYCWQCAKVLNIAYFTMLFLITSWFWVVLSIWDSSWSLFAKKLRHPQTPVKSLIIAYPEALKSRIQDSMVLTGTEAAGPPPAGARDLAGAGSCYLHRGKHSSWALSVNLRERDVNVHKPCAELMPLKPQCTLGPQHRLLRLSFGCRCLLAIFQIYFSLPSSCLFAGRYGGKEKNLVGLRKAVEMTVYIFVLTNPPLLIETHLMNSDISHLQIKGKQENVERLS